MRSNEFDEILFDTQTYMRTLLSGKAEEYASEDRLYNFKRAGEIDHCTPQRALWGMFLKHLVSVIDLVDGRVPLTKERVDEKIGDSLNYFVLLKAILYEIIEEEERHKAVEMSLKKPDKTIAEIMGL